MSRLLALSAFCLALLAGQAAHAETTDRTALLREAQEFGTLVGQAAQCKIDTEAISAYVSSALPRRLPTTGDPAFDEQMNQAFEQAMRGAAMPAAGCDQIAAIIAQPQ